MEEDKENVQTGGSKKRKDEKEEKKITCYHWGRLSKGNYVPQPHGMKLCVDDITGEIDEVKKIEDVGHTTIVLTTGGNVFSTGSNEFGLLGKGQSSISSVNDLNKMDFSKEEIYDISAGKSHVLALSKNGAVYAWGNSEFGQAGQLEEKKALTEEEKLAKKRKEGKEQKDELEKCIVKPNHIPLNNIRQILAIDDSSYALSMNGEVYSWGKPKHIGRDCKASTVKGEEGKEIIVLDNCKPIKVLFNPGKKEPEIRSIERKGKKVIAYVRTGSRKEGEDINQSRSIISPKRVDPKDSEEKKLSEEKGDLGTSERAGYMLPEQIEREYDRIRETFSSFYKTIYQKLIGLETALGGKADKFKEFTENPFAGMMKRDNKTKKGNLDIEETKMIHIDLKANLAELDQLQKEFGKMKETAVVNKDEGREDLETDPIFFLYKLIDDSIKLRKIYLLAFKLQTYHLKIKNKNVLNQVSKYVGSKDSPLPSPADLSKNLGAVLGECEYVIRRFNKLQAEFNKMYDDRINSVASRTVYHMIDTTFSECQAWKYVNLMCHYGILFQTGYEDLLSAAKKVDRLYTFYTDLKKGDPYRIFTSLSSAVEQEQQKDVIKNGRVQIAATTELIIAAKTEICSEGKGEDKVLGKLVTQVYEILVDLSTLRVAYYDLFLSFYEQLNAKK